MFSFKKKKSTAPNLASPSVSATALGANRQNPKILEVNLIKDEVQVSFDYNRGFFILIMMLVVAGLLVTEVYLGLDWWQRQENARVEELRVETDKIGREATELNNKLASALTFKEKSAAFSSLLEKHVYWNNFFSWLEKNTLTTIKYKDFVGDLTGEYTLSGQAQTLADISWQVKTLLDDPLTVSVEVKQATVGERSENSEAGPVAFELQLKVKPEIFLNNK